MRTRVLQRLADVDRPSKPIRLADHPRFVQPALRRRPRSSPDRQAAQKPTEPEPASTVPTVPTRSNGSKGWVPKSSRRSNFRVDDRCRNRWNPWNAWNLLEHNPWNLWNPWNNWNRRSNANERRRQQDDDDGDVPDKVTRGRRGAAKQRDAHAPATRRTADVRAMSSRSINVLPSARDRSAPTAASARHPRANPNRRAPPPLAPPTHRKTSGRCVSARSGGRSRAAPMADRRIWCPGSRGGRDPSPRGF